MEAMSRGRKGAEGNTPRRSNRKKKRSKIVQEVCTKKLKGSSTEGTGETSTTKGKGKEVENNMNEILEALAHLNPKMQSSGGEGQSNANITVPSTQSAASNEAKKRKAEIFAMFCG